MLYSGPSLDDDEEDTENQPVSHMNGSSGDAKPKTAQQKSGEALLRHILNSDCVEGSSYSFRYTLSQVHSFTYIVIQVRSFRYTLYLRNPRLYELCKARTARYAKSFVPYCVTHFT